MHRLLVLYPPPTDPDHFRSYYEDTHLALAAKLPGLRGYRYRFDVAAAEGESPYFCVFEADFDDAAALSAARASPEGQAVRADIPNYATGGAVALDCEFRADRATRLDDRPHRDRPVRVSRRRSAGESGTATRLRFRLERAARCRAGGLAATAIATAKSTGLAARKDFLSCAGKRLGKGNRSAFRQTRQERECRTL